MLLPSWPNPNNFHHIDLNIERVKNLLSRLNNPQLNLPPTIHVAGTNGKGSTIAFLKSIFNKAGYKVHRYTSPHLVNFNERIELADKIISDDMLIEILHEVEIASKIFPEIPVTFFEGTTVASFVAFSRVNADILLLETGLGGEFDATNVIDKPLCTIITTIDFDHQQYLGETLSQIANAKAGIIKKDCLTITTKQQQEVMEVIRNKTFQLNSNLVLAPDFIADKIDNLSEIKLGLNGTHQLENAILAMSCIMLQNKFLISYQQILDGLLNATWRGRLQKINDENFLKLLPKNCQFYIDGSHNIQGVKTLKEFLNNFSKQKISLIFSMLNDKNYEDFIREINEKNNYQIAEIIFMPIPNQPRAITIEEFSEVANKLKINFSIVNNFSQAFERINQLSSQITLLTGSLYLVAEFFKNFDVD
jgi:dihydrofolate synthase/folylpolyglutamate synthase